MKHYYTPKEACDMLKIHPNTLNKLRKTNQIKYVRINSAYRYDVDDYIEVNTVNYQHAV